MNRVVTLTTLILSALLSAFAQPAAANEDDKFWDAANTVNGVRLVAKYKESPENGLLDQTLEVQLENAPANATLSISINDRVVGQMVTNAFGRGVYRRDIFGAQAGPDGRPVGPRINTGDVIRVYRGAQGISASFQPRQ